MQKAFSFKNLLRHVFAVVTLTSLFLVSTGWQQPGGADGARKRDKAGRSRNGG